MVGNCYNAGRGRHGDKVTRGEPEHALAGNSCSVSRHDLCTFIVARPKAGTENGVTLVDAPALVDACTDRWYNQTLCQVNDSVVRRRSCKYTTVPERRCD
jgi:hypothetical protein